ncbi:hypothetical protein GYH30_021495 [Glycine max]|nr:hypothetical protein GYH30_021495 [Glycine max]
MFHGVSANELGFTVHGEGFVQHGLLEQRLCLQRAQTRARAWALLGMAFEVCLLEGLGLGLELIEGVAIAALPDGTLDGPGPAGAEADLPLVRAECRADFRE